MVSKKIIRIRMSNARLERFFKEDVKGDVIIKEGRLPEDAVLFHLIPKPEELCIDYYFYSNSGVELMEGGFLESIPIRDIVFTEK